MLEALQTLQLVLEKWNAGEVEDLVQSKSNGHVQLPRVGQVEARVWGPLLLPTEGVGAATPRRVIEARHVQDTTGSTENGEISRYKGEHNALPTAYFFGPIWLPDC